MSCFVLYNVASVNFKYYLLLAEIEAMNTVYFIAIY